MAQVQKIDSNVVGLRYAEELTIKVLPGSPVWRPLEPNSFADFGGEITTVARNPINPSRQRKKGVTTDLDASGGLNSDLTQENLQDVLQGFFFADLRKKSEETVTSVTATTTYNVAANGTDYTTATLAFGKGFTDAANNGKKTVASSTATTIVVNETLVNETPGADAVISRVGVVGAAGDIDVDSTGAFDALTSTVLDFTTLGFVAGEWIFIGGDAAALAFVAAANNGFKRIRTIAATRLEFDKSDLNMSTEASDTETIELYFGRVLKNEIGTTIKRRTYSLERQLGAPDDASPTQIQAEYLDGCVPAEFTFNVATADKITCDLSFVGLDQVLFTGPTALRSGTRPAIVEADAFNTSSDFTRIRMAVHDDTDSAPTALFAFLQEMNITINNNLSPNKAVGTLGAFEVTAGTFQVGGDLTAYFSNVTAITSVRNNSDVTLDWHIVKSNSGVSVDLPLITLGDGRAAVEQDEAITIPLGMDAATAAKIATTLDYTLLMVFYDFLPNAADT